MGFLAQSLVNIPDGKVWSSLLATRTQAAAISIVEGFVVCKQGFPMAFARSARIKR
jgi:hypothetical protein